MRRFCLKGAGTVTFLCETQLKSDSDLRFTPSSRVKLRGRWFAVWPEYSSTWIGRDMERFTTAMAWFTSSVRPFGTQYVNPCTQIIICVTASYILRRAARGQHR